MIQNFTDVLPFAIYSPADEIALYSQNGTGVGGRFVVFETGNNAPTDGLGDFSAATPGYNYEGVTNLRTENKRKVTPAPSGSTKFNVLGVTLYGTAEYDNNGLKLLFNPHRKTELRCVTSGESTNVLCDGVVRLSYRAYSGVPIPGHVAVVSNAGEGKIQIVNPATLSASSTPFAYHHVVAKVISSSGTANSFGGYADFKLMLK